jgi:hypothetical protein
MRPLPHKFELLLPTDQPSVIGKGEILRRNPPRGPIALQPCGQIAAPSRLAKGSDLMVVHERFDCEVSREFSSEPSGFPANGPPPGEKFRDEREALAGTCLDANRATAFRPNGPIEPNEPQIWPPAVTPNNRAGTLAPSQPYCKLLGRTEIAAKSACVPTVPTVTVRECHGKV